MSTITSEKIATAKAYINDIEAVKTSLKTKFEIGDDVPFNQYPDLISPVCEGETTFYKCTSSYHDPYVPAYKNIEIAGMTTPTDGNGTFVNIRPDYAGFFRVWKNGNYAISFDHTNKYWCIHNASSTVSYYDCYFRVKNFATSEEGTDANPWIWDNLGGSSSDITDLIADSDLPSYEYRYVYLTLKGGTAYKFGVVNNLSADDGYINYECGLYSSDGNYLTSIGSSADSVNGHACNYTGSYTPSTDCIVKLYVSKYNSSNCTGLNFVCYPAPEAWVEPSEDPWDYTFSVVNGTGTLTLSAVDIAEHKATKTWSGKRIYQNTKEDGSIYYVPADTITEGLTWSRFAPNVDEIWSADATLRANYLDDGNYYPENATVWKIDIASDNTAYYMWVAGNDGNIIDWGDGTQTTTQYAANSQSGASLNTAGVYSHTYTSTGTYIIQVIGDSVERIVACCSNSGSTTSNTNITEAIQCSKSLVNGAYLFSNCGGLRRIADTFQLPRGMTSALSMFNACTALIYAPKSLRLPAGCTIYNQAFQSCNNLSVDISHWFDDIVAGENQGKSLSYAFYNCSKMTGTLPAEKLWKDYSWYLGGNVGDAFINATKLIATNDIPELWK